MAFDGDYHGAVPLLLPTVHHPDAAPTTRVLSTPLAGAYSFALNTNEVGSLLFQGHISRANAAGLSHWLAAPSSLIAEIEGYIPTWADKLYAKVTFATYALDGGVNGAITNCSVSTPTTGGPVFTAAINRRTRDQIEIDALRFDTFTASAVVDLSATTLGDDVVCSVNFALQSDEEDPADRRDLAASPVAVLCWWESDHG